ncbi:hypothetical protein DNTS_016662 [Danionella cerebrum]|uniref:RRM domain-containing protein n=1 Tax=Danionella cerebrum TaxID=2873325 RepID=A0A553R9M2_9TELE|nr:hypothetical protein DNTS_016662 [Danionella translucida]
MFDQPGPPALLNNSILGLSGQGPPSFPPQGALGGSGYGPMGLGQNQGPPSLSMQHPGPPGHPGSRGFVGHRQPFSPPHQGPPFSPPHIPYGVQSGLQQPMHHDPPPSHPPLMQQHHHPTHQQHRQDLPPQPLLHSQPPPQHHHHSRDQHMSPPNYCQPNQSGHRQMQSRPQGNTHRKNHTRPRMASTPLQQITPQRNSNLRELPIATSNNNSCQSVPSVPVVKAAQDTKQGLVAQSGPAGKGGPVAQRQGSGRTLQQLVKPGPAAQSSTTPQDPDEDEETRKYRLKIEEQKRLREEVLRRKELRRQQQAGERKKELLERIGAQHPNQTSHVQNSALHPAPQTPQPVPSLVSNGTPQDPSLNLVSPRPNVKTRLLTTKAQPPAAGWSGPQKQQITAPGANLQGLPPQRRNITPLNPQRQGAVQTNQLQAPGLTHPHPGAKRTVMQRISSMESPQVPQKIRLIKRQGEGDAGPNTGFLQPQQQAVGRASLQQRPGAMRKITVGTGGVQNQQAERGVGYQANRLLVRGRGRGRGRGVGRFGQQQNQRAPKIEPSTVSIEGLSTTTTNKQLMNLLNSIGPIETFKMLPDQRKAIAKFVDPQHALSFQHSFHSFQHPLP